MFVTSDEQRSGLLVAVITGGRPELKQRPTRKLIENLKEAGVSDVVWVVSEKDAPGYEHDDNDLCVYPMDWAEKYASEHWMQPTPYEPGTFFGAFVGREWACLEAERRGCWVIDVTEEQLARIVTVDNRASDLATYNDETLLDILQDLPDLTGTGYSDSDLADLIASMEEEELTPEEHNTDPYEDFITIRMQLPPHLAQQWLALSNGFDSPEEALEYLLDNRVAER